LVFQLLYFYLGITIGVIVTFCNNFTFVNAVVAVLALFLLFATWAKPIFKKQYDRIRTQLNLLTIAFLQIPFLYANLNSE
jgi:hypothetical protein